MVKVAGYTTAQVCKLLRRQRQALYRSGILGKNEVIPREFPFGNSFPLYNEKVVDKWAAAMRRYDAEKAFGKLHKTADLIKAIEYTNPSRDVVCPKCDGPAVKEGGDEDSKASKRVWCPTCGIEENFRG